MRIFQDIPEGIDETWTHGALLGGMARFTEREIAEAYFNAADVVVDRVLVDGQQDGYEVVNPALFLYRHGVEVYLKAIVKPAKLNHDLVKLLEGFREHVRQRYNEDLPTWLTAPVIELATYDPGSDAFRYSEPRAGRLRHIDEVWVDLGKLQKRMRMIRWALERTIVADQFGLRDLSAMVPNPFRENFGR